MSADTSLASAGQALRDKVDALALQVVEAQRVEAGSRARRVDDARQHVLHLAEAVHRDSPRLFVDYVSWARDAVHAREVSVEELREQLQALGVGVRTELSGELVTATTKVLDLGTAALAEGPATAAAGREQEAPFARHADEYLRALLDYRTDAATGSLLQLVGEGLSIPDLYLEVLQPALQRVGWLWQSGEISVAQEHYCTAAVQLVLARLHERIFATEPNGYRLLAASLGDELHDIGIRMVADLLALRGWDTTYLGSNLPAPALVELAVERDVHVVAFSTTLAAHLPFVEQAVQGLRAHFGDRARVVVGGRAFAVDTDLWRKLGADGSAPDARRAADLVEDLVS